MLAASSVIVFLAFFVRGIPGFGSATIAIPLLVLQDPDFLNWRAQIVDQAAQLRLPAVYAAPEFVPDGGLISYAANQVGLYHRAATHVDKILKGAKPGDLPIEQPTKFELLVNSKTAKAIGVKISNEILLRADKVIE